MAAPTLSASRTIGPYSIESYLGGGGMAEVFLGVKPGLDGRFQRRVAIKRILPQHGEDEHFRSQFAEEVRLVAQLRHPHIVSALDSGEDAGLYYLVLEWVDGTDLERLLAWQRATRRTLPLGVLLRIAYGMASALAYIHAPPFEVVHRDVTPHNVLLGTCGEVKLSDFGISLFPGREYRTRTNLLKGKIAYMAPEQLQPSSSGASAIDFRSDLFSFGTVLYEMVTGESPFPSAHGFLAQAHAVLQGNEALGYDKGLRGTPVELARLIRRLHARAPERRPTATDEVVQALRALQQIESDDALGQLVRAWKARKSAGDAPLEPPRPQAGACVPGTTASLSRPSDLPPATSAGSRPTDELSSPALSCEAALPESVQCVGDASAGASSAVLPSVAEPTREGVGTRGSEPVTGPIGKAEPARSERARSSWVVPLVVIALAGSSGAALLSVRRDEALANTLRRTPAPLPDEPDLRAPTAASPVSADLPAPAVPAMDERPPAVPSHEPPAAELERSHPARRAAESRAADGRAAEARGSARVRIVVRPWGRVWIDGRLLGQAPVEIAGVTPGMHRIEAGYDRPLQSHRVELRTGKSTLRYDLE